MAEETKNLKETPKEKKTVNAYTVYKYDDGSVDVKDAEVKGTNKMEVPEIFDDIKDVSKLIKNKELTDACYRAAYVGAYNGVAKYYQDIQEKMEASKNTSEKN